MKLLEEYNAIVEHNKSLVDKLNFIINWADKAGYLPNHTFMFPDGDTWCADEYSIDKEGYLCTIDPHHGHKIRIKWVN